MKEIAFFDRVHSVDNGHGVFDMHRLRIDEVISSYEECGYTDDINNIIEMYNCTICIDELRKGGTLPTSESDAYLKAGKKFNRIIGMFFSKVSEENLIEIAAKLENGYIAEFWHIMCKHKRIDLLTKECFGQYLNLNPRHITAVLTQKKLVVKYKSEIIECLKESPHDIRVIIDYLFGEATSFRTQLYVADIFNAEELRGLYLEYINSDEPSMNTLTLLQMSQNDPKLGIDDEVRLIAKRKVKEMGEKISKHDAHYIQHSVSVSFRNAQKAMEYVEEDEGPVFIYDIKWIRENLDYPTLLNNFIYLFGYTDLQYRCMFTLNRLQPSQLEDVMLLVKGKSTYDVGNAFELFNSLHVIQMQRYCSELHRDGIEIEEVFKWFFETYLKEEFGIGGFSYNQPSSGVTYLEKCKLMAIEIDRVLKQYRQYCQYGYIDPELFGMSSEHLVFSQIPSVNENKYVYANSELIYICTGYLFSDWMFSYLGDGRIEDASNLYEVITKHNDIKPEDYTRRYQIDALEKLKEFGVVKIENGCFVLDREKTIILKQLKEAGVLCYNYCGAVKPVIDKLIESGDLKTEATLFSTQEQDYLDYMLNKSKFSNGHDLRNKCVHGTYSEDERAHSRDYMEFLKIMVLIIIKINEEFCLKYPIKS